MSCTLGCVATTTVTGLVGAVVATAAVVRMAMVDNADIIADQANECYSNIAQIVSTCMNNSATQAALTQSCNSLIRQTVTATNTNVVAYACITAAFAFAFGGTAGLIGYGLYTSTNRKAQTIKSVA